MKGIIRIVQTQPFSSPPFPHLTPPPVISSDRNCSNSSVLQLVQPEEEFSFQHFLNPTNKFKNRYANIVACRFFFKDINSFPVIPFFLSHNLLFLFTKERKGDNLSFFYADDHTRVLLNPIDGVAGSDYINASFIDVSFHYFFVSFTSLRAFYNKVV